MQNFSVLFISETKQCCWWESWNSKLLVTVLKHYLVKVGRSMKIKRLACKQTSKTLRSMQDRAYRRVGFDHRHSVVVVTAQILCTLRKFLSKLLVA